LTDAKKLKLPAFIGGGLYLRSLKSTRDLFLPGSEPYKFYLSAEIHHSEVESLKKRYAERLTIELEEIDADDS